ncbi:hypothetical protein JOB18_036092 [Solea senegalensis]|uniref:Uncharacterized protein n=1 Tax=Solea senegalensis TaxID=28829 RepID=A0AAV6T9P0_SOLSE|nr:hypothetical protein JOB18_036092 [Solea senegalensis]
MHGLMTWVILNLRKSCIHIHSYGSLLFSASGKNPNPSIRNSSYRPGSCHHSHLLALYWYFAPGPHSPRSLASVPFYRPTPFTC